MPAVTVIVATYNSATTLRCALGSILGQTMTDFEVHVVGDACTDGSAEVVSSLADPRLHWINLAENSGSQAVPNREGLRLASAPFVAYLGHDDLWLPWHLEALLAAQRSTGAEFLHASCLMIDPEGPFDLLGPEPHRIFRRRRWFAPPSTWLHRRDLAGRLAFWPPPETLPWPIDHDALIRSARARVPMAHHNEVTVFKFPSFPWSAYSRQSGHPQPEALAEIQRDPRAARKRRLDQFAAFRPHPTLEDRWRFVARGFRSFLLDWFANVWPLSAFLRWSMQRTRKRIRGKRGLPPA